MRGSAKVAAISSCANIMDEWGRKRRLWEVLTDPELYLNEISGVLRTEEHVRLSLKECAHMRVYALKTH